MPSMTGAAVLYRPLQAGDEHAVLRLLRACGYSPDERWWRWMNEECPQGKTLVELAVAGDGEVVGHYSVWPKLLRSGGATLRAGMAIHAAVHPDHRGLSILKDLMQRTVARCREEGIAFIYAFPNDQVWLVYLRFLQWKELGDLKACEISLEGWDEPEQGGSLQWVLRDPPVFEEAHGRIQQAMLEEGSLREKIAAVKDRAWLEWRYARHPRVRYPLLEGRSSSGELVAYGVLKLYEKAGIRYGHIVDFGVLPSAEQGFPALVRAALRFFKSRGADVASCWFSDEQLGFRKTGFITHVGIRPVEPENSGETFMLNPWHVTMGDSDAF